MPLNSTMIAVGLPTLADDLGVERSAAAVLVTAYLAAMLLCQPVGGRLGDRHGNRQVLRIALVGFVLTSVAAGVAPTFGSLLVARCAQAVFGAALIPNAQAILRAVVAPRRHGRAFGFVGTGIGAGAAVGPVLGGVLADGAGWRGIFFVNVPLGLLALVLLARAPRATVEAAGGRGRGMAFGLLSAGSFRAACLSQSASTFSLYTVLLVLPLLLAERGWAATTVGLATASLTAGLLVLGPVGGSLGDRHGRRRPIVAGLAVVVAGCGILALGANAEDATALVLGPLVMGAGLGFAGASLQAAAMQAVPPAVTGSAAGLFSASRYVGSIAGSLAISASGVTGSATAQGVLVATIVAAAVATVAGRFAVPPADATTAA